MKLDLFNKWKKIGNVGDKIIELKTEKRSSNAFITLLRDQSSQQIITKGVGINRDTSQKSAIANLKALGVQGVYKAVEDRQHIQPAPKREEPNDVPSRHIDWRDGSNHRYRAQRRIVGEGEETIEDLFNMIEYFE